MPGWFSETKKEKTIYEIKPEDAEFQAEAIGIINSLLLLSQERKISVAAGQTLSPIFIESLLQTRDILCCWKEQKLNPVAQESLSHRNFKIHGMLTNEAKRSDSVLEMNMLQESQGYPKSWDPKYFTLKSSTLFFSATQHAKPHKSIRLNDVKTEAHPVNEGTGDPTFFVDCVEGKENVRYRFKTGTDIERQTWLQAFDYYRLSRSILAHFDSMPVDTKLVVLTSEVFCDDIPLQDQFLLAKHPPGRQHDYRPKVESLASDFACCIPQTFGLGKPRVFRFDFNSEPRRLLCFRQENLKTPYIELSRENILDTWMFSGTKDKPLLKIYIERDKDSRGEQKRRRNNKEFLFSPQEAERFKKVMMNFLDDNYGFLFRHHKLVGQLPDLTEEEIMLIHNTYYHASRIRPQAKILLNKKGVMTGFVFDDKGGHEDDPVLIPKASAESAPPLISPSISPQRTSVPSIGEKNNHVLGVPISPLTNVPDPDLPPDFDLTYFPTNDNFPRVVVQGSIQLPPPPLSSGLPLPPVSGRSPPVRPTPPSAPTRQNTQQNSIF